MNYFNRIFILIHDGYFGCQSGAGTMNKKLLLALKEIIDPQKVSIFILPVFVHQDSPAYNRDWHEASQKICKSIGAKVYPIQNGTNGIKNYGTLNEWCMCSENSSKKIQTLLSKGMRNLVLSFDSPFLGTIQLLGNVENLVHIHTPHCTAHLHSGTNKNAVNYEEECFKLLPENTYVGAIGSYMKKHLEQECGVISPKIISFKNGILPNNKVKRTSKTNISRVFESYLIPENVKFVFCYGRAQKYKGFHVFLQAIKNLGENAPYFILVAPANDHDENYVSELLSFHAENNLKGTIITEWLDIEIGIILQNENLKAVVVPSIKEPFGLIPMEVYSTFYSNAVVISSNTGGLEEQLVDGVTGKFFQNANDVELSEKIQFVFNMSKNQLSHMRENARKNIFREYNYVNNIVDVIHEMSKNYERVFNEAG